MKRSLAIVAALAAGTPAQQQPDAPVTSESLLARFHKLDAAARANVVRTVELRLARIDHELLQAIQSMQKGKSAYAPQAERPWFDPAEFAPSAKPRTLLAATTAEHRRATNGMQAQRVPADLDAAVVYDWGTGACVRTLQDLGDEQRFANLARGHVPGADQAVAQVLALLDTDPVQRRLGSYFEHLYADREGAVFAGISLYDAWRSGIRFEMPDTDAIAFARLVLDTRAVVDPIPADRRRERLYARISDGFAQHHEHRTMRLALAATFVAANPVLDPSWQTLVERAHWLWQTNGRDPKAVAARLLKTPDRGALVREIDAALAKDNTPMTKHRRMLADLASFVRACTDEALRSAGV